MNKIKYLIVSTLIIMFLFGTLSISYAAYTSPYAEPTYIVKYGSVSTGVKWVQDMLKQNGYTITIDGAFGTKTKNAVQHFQKYNNLDADGIVGSQTRDALKKSVARLTASSGTSSNSTSSNNTSANTSSVTTTSINKNMYATANVNFRSGPGTSNSSYGVVSKGLSVYVLQQRSDGWSYVKYNNRYGYISSKYLSYDANTSTTINANGLPTFNRGTTNLMNIIKNCKSYYANNNFYYSLASGVRSIPADKSTNYNSMYYTDCSSYVTWVLYEYALANGKTSMNNYFSSQVNSAAFARIGASGGNEYLKVINGLDNAQEGDILVTPGHVEFFSSYSKNSNGSINLKVYNCGSNASIKINGISNSATKYASEIQYILRVK